MKKIIPLLIAVVLFLMSVVSASALSAIDEQVADYTLPQMRQIAINALSMDFSMEADDGSWDDVIIIQETPLYDLYGDFIGYCFDLSCGEQRAYIIVSAQSSVYPIIQFAPHAASPYIRYGVTYSTGSNACIYVAPGQYYIESTEDTLLNLTSFETVKYDIASSVELTRVESGTAAEYNDIFAYYLSGSTPGINQLNQSNYLPHVNLTSVPNLQWTRGCSPTAMAMIIEYHYADHFDVPGESIDGLANYMGTSDIPIDGIEGWTDLSSVPVGARNYLNYLNLPYSFLDYAAKNLLGYPQTGYENNPFSALQEEINNNRPVFICMNNANVSTPEGWPEEQGKKFTDHSVTAVGYNSTNLAYYVIIHTTHVPDGDVYVSLSPDVMGDYAFCYVRP